MKRLLAICLSAVMAVACLGAAACGGTTYERHTNPQVLTEAGMYPIIKEEYKDTVTLKMMGANDASLNSDWANNKFFKRMKELTGVNFEFDVYGGEMFAEKKGLVFNSGSDLPDVFFKPFFNNYDELTYGMRQGQLLGLTELINDYAPNIKSLLDRYPRVKKSITAPDGQIYALPTIYVNNAAGDVLMRGFWWMDRTWLTELGKEMPTTADELLDVLRAFKGKCTKANSYPLLIAGLDEMRMLFSIFGIDGQQYWVQEKLDGSHELEFVATKPEFKAAIEFFHTLQAEGLINPDWASYDLGSKYANGVQENMYGMFFASSPYHVVGANLFKNFIAVDPMTSSVNSTPFWSASDNLQRGTFAISATCEYPELAIRWIDTLYDIDEDYWIWAIAGGENEEWVWNDEAHTKWHLTVPLSSYSEIMSTILIQPGDGMPYAVNEAFYDKCADELEAYIRPYRMRQMSYGRVSYPLVYFNRDDLISLSGLAADINTCIDRFLSEAVKNGIDSSNSTNWDSFSRQFESVYSLAEYMDILTRALDDFNASI